MLRSVNNVKSGTATAGSLTLEASASQSFLVRNIHVEPSTNDTFVTLKVGRKTVGYWRVKGKSGNHLPLVGDLEGDTLMGLLNGVFDGAFNIPVGVGEKFVITRYAEAGAVTIVYDEYDAGDIKPTDPNGSQSSVLSYAHYIDYDTEITAAGEVTLNQSHNPAEFPDFPIGKNVPDNHVIELLAIAAAGVAEGDGSNDEGRMSHLRLVQEQVSLGDEDFAGWPIKSAGNTTNALLYGNALGLFGPYTDVVRGRPMLFNPPHRFLAGQELTVIAAIITGDETAVSASALDIAFILRLSRG